MRINAGTTILLLLLAGAGTLFGEVTATRLDLVDTESARSSYLALPFRVWGGGKYRPEPEKRTTVISMSNARCGYALQLSGPETPASGWQAALGMPYPSNANWYSNAFFSFQCGTVKSSACQVEILECRSGVSEGRLQLRYRQDSFSALVEITLLEDDDRLLFSMQPEEVPAGAEEYQLEFLCYPSSYAGGHQQGLNTRQREAQTPRRTLSPGPAAVLERDESWVCFYDRYYDVALSRGSGPCAILYNPAQVAQAQARISGYACSLYLSLPVQQPAGLMLWDFRGWGNRPALDFMQAIEVSY